MPILYNWQTRKVEHLPDEAVDAALNSGAYSFRRGVRVPIVSPDGQPGTVDSSEAPSLLQQGWRYYTAGEQRARTQAAVGVAQSEAFDAPVSAALAGGLRGATLGLSDVAMGALGGEQMREDLRRLRDQNPIASTVGEVGGSVLSVATGVGPAAQAAKIGMGAVKATKAAQAMQSLAMAGKAGEVASKMLAAGAGSAVEGAFYGAGELLTEAALGDPNLTAKNALITMGANVVLGGAAGGLLEGAGTAAVKGLQKIKEKTRQIVVEDLNLPGKVGEVYATALSKLRILNPEQAEELKVLFQDKNRGWREEVMRYFDNPQAMTEDGTRQILSLVDTGRFEADFLGYMREAGRNELSRVKMAKSVSPLNEVRSITKAFDKIERLIADDPTSYLGVSQKLGTLAEDFKGAVSQVKTLADLNEVLLMTRQNLDDRFRNLLNGNKSLMRYEEKNTLDLIMDVRGELGSMLKDNKLFGLYAERFAAADEAFNEFLTAQKHLRKNFYTRQPGRQGEELVIDERKVRQALRSPDVNPAKNAALDTYEKAVQKLADVGAQFAEMPQLAQRVGQHVQETAQRIDHLRKVRSAQILLNQLEPTTGKSVYGALLGFGVAELAPDDIPGTGLAGALIGSAFVNPKTALRYLVKLERGNNAVMSQAAPAVRKFLGLPIEQKATEILTSAKPITMRQVVREFVDDDVEDPTDVDGLKRSLEKLQDPQHLDTILARANPGLDQVAPMSYAAMAQQAANAAAFVLSKAPPEVPGDLMAGRTRYTPSQAAQLQSYLRAAFQPAVVFDELRAGRLKPETVETISQLYPELHAELQNAAIEALSERNKSVSYRRKIELSKLLMVPTTPALAGLDVLQSAYALQPAEVQAPRPGGNMKPPANILSPADALAQRRS